MPGIASMQSTLKSIYKHVKGDRQYCADVLFDGLCGLLAATGNHPFVACCPEIS